MELKGERRVLEEMRGNYKVALSRVNERIAELAGRDDLSGIRQRRYQEALAEQIGGIVDDLGDSAYRTLEGYLRRCYEEGFVGSLYSLQKQGIPLAFPLDQAKAARACTMSAGSVKLSRRVYRNADRLKRQVVAEITRGFADGSSSTQVAQHVATGTTIEADIRRNVKGRADQAFRRSMTIARTEKGRVMSDARLDAMRKAKKAGADVVKQWDSTMDSRTRKDHRRLDGQVRELDEPFEVAGRKAMAPHKFGRPEEDINCRCVCLQRARAAMRMPEGADSSKWDGERQCFVDLSDAKDFGEFRRKYDKLISNRGALSGALNDKNDPMLKRRIAHAEAYYEEVRRRDRKAEVDAVSNNSGMSRTIVERAYDHLFVNKYELRAGLSTFNPDYNISLSWQRLREGRGIEDHDLILLQHEAYEHDLMKKGMAYDDAHEETDKLYNYGKALREYLKKRGDA